MTVNFAMIEPASHLLGINSNELKEALNTLDAGGNNKELVTINKVCEQLHITRPTVYSLFKTGDLKLVKIGRASRVPQQSLDDYLERIGA